MGKLGDTLRERRQALRLSLDDAEDGTKIRARLLQALEDGNYDRLPNPGYVRGYVSSYARFLELDPVPLLNMYKAEIGPAHNAPELNLPQAAPRVVAPRGQQHAVPLKTAMTLAAVVAVLALAVWGIARLFTGPEPTAPEPNSPRVTSETPAPKAAEESPTTQAPTETATSAQPFTMSVKVSSDGASWLRIEVDGKHAYEGVLTAGQSKQYEVAEKATVRIGKPEWVTVEKDGVKVPITRSGDASVVELSATK